MKKYWHYREFTAPADGMGVLDREALINREVLPFLQERKLTPQDCIITWLVDPDNFGQQLGTVTGTGRGKPKMVCLVFYISSSELL